MKERVRQEEEISTATLVWNQNILPHWDNMYVCVCVCVCTCMRVCVHLCACMCSESSVMYQRGHLYVCGDVIM